MKVYISPKIRKSIEKHLYSNMLFQDSLSPLILGIFGPTGEGKTYQLEYVLNELGVSICEIGGGELENENAGHPAQILRTEYRKASEAQNPTVLVINDIDAIIGKWGDLTQYTVNRQNVNVQLMDFCDHPFKVAGRPTKRIPIFITGNNPSILYEPLKRPGRMRLMEWKPDIQEKIIIVSNIFESINPEIIRTYVVAYPDRPVSFWSDLKSEIWEDKMLAFLHSKYSNQELMSRIAFDKKLVIKNVNVTENDIERYIHDVMDVSNKSYINQSNY